MIKDKLKFLRKKRNKWWDMSGSMGKGKTFFLPLEIAKQRGYKVIYMDLERSINSDIFDFKTNDKNNRNFR